MKKVILVLMVMFCTATHAQEQKQIFQITVSGDGKVMVKPDYVIVNFGIDNVGKDATEVKKIMTKF